MIIYNYKARRENSDPASLPNYVVLGESLNLSDRGSLVSEIE